MTVCFMTGPPSNQKPRAKINMYLLKLFVSGICQSDGKQTNTHTDKQRPSLETQGSFSAMRLPALQHQTSLGITAI